MREPPAKQRTLAARLRNLAGELGIAEPRLRRTVAHTIVGQMLPAGVVKGGAPAGPARHGVGPVSQLAIPCAGRREPIRSFLVSAMAISWAE